MISKRIPFYVPDPQKQLGSDSIYQTNNYDILVLLTRLLFSF